MTITEHFAKVEKDFRKKIGYKEIRKCCINCMFCHGYEEEPMCMKLEEAGVNRHVQAHGVCKLWTERFGIPKELGSRMTEIEFNKKNNYRWIDSCSTCKYFRMLYPDGCPVCTHPEGQTGNGLNFHVVSENCICDEWEKGVEEND